MLFPGLESLALSLASAKLEPFRSYQVWEPLCPAWAPRYQVSDLPYLVEMCLESGLSPGLSSAFRSASCRLGQRCRLCPSARTPS